MSRLRPRDAALRSLSVRRFTPPLRTILRATVVGIVLVFSGLGPRSVPAAAPLPETIALVAEDTHGLTLRVTCTAEALERAVIDRAPPEVCVGCLALPRGARAEWTVAAVPSARDRIGATSPARCLPRHIVRTGPRQTVRGLDLVPLFVHAALVRPVDANRPAATVALDVKVDFRGGEDVYGDPRLASQLWAPLWERLLINHASVLAATSAAPIAPADERYGYEYIIITSGDAPFTAWADSIRALRTLQGIRTGVFTTDEIGSTWSEIKDFLTDAYVSWEIPPAAFLLLGDHPGTGNSTGIPAPIWGGSIPSDNIYADVNGDDLPDMVPARMTARSETELAAMVGKLLAHERTPPLEPAFYDHPVLAAGWDPDGWSVMETETLYGFWNLLYGKTPRREYVATAPGSSWPDPMWVATYGPEGLGYLPATPEYLTDWGGSAERINADVNAGAFCLLHRGVSTTTGWGAPAYTVNDVLGLTNTSYPFVFSLDGLTGNFTWSGACLAEAFHRSPHGAVGLVAATDVTYWSATHEYYPYWIAAIWPDFATGGGGAEPELRPAFALVLGKLCFYMGSGINPTHKKATIHTFHYHGGPFAVMNDQLPTELSVEHATYCVGGATEFIVQADPGALIGLSIDGELIGRGIGTGAPLPIPIYGPLPDRWLRIVVTKQNHLRYDVSIPTLDPSDVAAPEPPASGRLVLEVVGPNPSMAACRLRMAAPAHRAGRAWSLQILDAAGRCVRELAGRTTAGSEHVITWDGCDRTGNPAASGVYLARLRCGDAVASCRIARVE